MPEREPNMNHVSNGKSMSSVNPHQSAWLTHWSGTRFDASTSTNDHLTRPSRSGEDDHNIKKPKPHKPIGVEAASDSFGSSKGINDVDLAISLKKPSSQSFPFFKVGQESGTSSISKDEQETTALEPQVSSFEPEIVPHIPTEQVKYHMFFGESSYSYSKPASRVNTGQETYKLDTVFESNEPKRIMECETTEMPSFLRQNNPARLRVDPSTSTNHSPAFIEEHYQRMQKHIRLGFFPNQDDSQEMIKSAAIHHGPCSFQNLPRFVHDVETTRICTPLEGLAGGLHSFSRTTHSLLITKQTDVNLYPENQIFRELTQFKGKALTNNAQRGVKLQLLGSSSDHESENDVKTAENVQKNESSADTDAMDMESFKEANRLSGVYSSRSNKNTTVDSNLPPLPPLKHKIELPDINLELPAQPATSSSADKTEPSPSRTQSLDMNTIRFDPDQTSDSKSDDRSKTNPCPDPESRWIKRLKLSSSSHGTKSLKLAASSSANGKLNKFFSKCEPTLDKGLETEVRAKRECKDIITLSHSWIQRWSRKNPENVESCKGENSKLAVEEFRKRQFPSIAAMALMGKTMTGFSQCEFQKKEAFVVWNTKGFR